jgi:Domain of unknown function (DUF1836)
MDQIQEMLENLGLDNQITLEEIPKIDLYMDQVIQLFENKFSSSKRNEEDKVLTKTMINNYAKGKLFFPIKNKKYSKEHLILISLIYQLKGALSINDIKETLFKVNDKTSMNQFNLDGFYESYLHIANKNIENFNKDVVGKSVEVKNEIDLIEDHEKTDLQKVLMIASLANMSNLYRRAAEKLVDELASDKIKKEK